MKHAGKDVDALLEIHEALDDKSLYSFPEEINDSDLISEAKYLVQKENGKYFSLPSNVKILWLDAYDGEITFIPRHRHWEKAQVS